MRWRSTFVSTELDVDCAVLAEVILARRAVGPGVRCHNVGGWHSERDLLAWPEMRELVAELVKLGDIDIAWANVNEPGDANASHIHQGPWSRSGVLFVAGRSGDLVFERERVTPEPGTCVLFPATLWHRVELCSEWRVTIAFNLR